MPGRGARPWGRGLPQPPGEGSLKEWWFVAAGAATSGAGLTWVGIYLLQHWRRVSLGVGASGIGGALDAVCRGGWSGRAPQVWGTPGCL